MNRIPPVKRSKQQGQSIVELTLIVPLVLVALYIPADFGLAFLMANQTQTAAREGARIGSGLPSPFGNNEANTVKNEVLNRLPNNSFIGSRSVTVKFYSGTSCMQIVEVTAQINYNYFLYQLMRFFGVTVNNTEPIIRTTRMRYNFQPDTYSTPCGSPSTYGPYSS